MGWGKGWEVGARKAMYEQSVAAEKAARILAEEHGVRHDSGARPDLCPKCKDEAKRKPSP